MNADQNKPNPCLLVVLDGWGIAPAGPNNAVTQADPECFNHLVSTCSNTAIHASGAHVGLPDDQFGNSEVGHMNLGAGRVVYQDISRINNAIQDGSFATNPAFLNAIKAAGSNGRIHLMGLTSDGGVHSTDTHYFALIDALEASGFDGQRVFFHAITDGRDSDPTGGEAHLEALSDKLEATGVGRIASVCGRYFAMDRDKNWDRLKKAWDVYTLGEGEVVPDAAEAVRASYAEGITDEFITPKIVVEHDRPLGLIRDDDVVIWFNFRADRARQICWALGGKSFDEFKPRKTPNVTLVAMTPYASDIKADVAFPPTKIKNTLGKYLASLGLRQFRCAETEKYAHVTYFFNGGVEQPNVGELRIVVPSPKVATYDMQPEMSAATVADKVSVALRSGEFDFVLVNFANPDMTGHTGSIEAAVGGIKAADAGLKTVLEAATEAGFVVLVTADHGNAEEMQIDDRKSTQHSHNLVPLILAGNAPERALKTTGKLADVAPTILELMGLEIPTEMTGESLLV
ncbi:2,3-bisphosphoglycerate-independent phosphoglycerate mutase [Planctomycetota bacterium]|nr:2,3-bisphosphoglycerate-independent phosphoglycerate mutase [Planctomycetota bacterium]